MHSTDYLDDAIEVSSVDDFIKQINLIYQEEESIEKRFYFRGQSVDYWDIRPSVFRNNLISVEHSLMAEPIRKLPKEFRGLGDTFEVMEKYQHYGLSTRLLDVTSNPLVALYFACEPNDYEEVYKSKDSTEEKRNPHGIVYFKRTDSVYRYDDLIIRIIAYLSEQNLNEEINMNKVLLRLRREGFWTSDHSNDENVINLIKLLQKSYIVLPVVNNERLSRQSGAFLLPAKFNFKNSGKDVRKAIIEKSVCNLRDEFEQTVFYITSDNKERIREELNQFNINEATLFPELEYQLKHIQIELGRNTKSVVQFEKFNEQFNTSDKNSLRDIKIRIDQIEAVIRGYGFEDDIVDEIVKVFKENNVTDWYKRENIQSKIRISIRKILLGNNYTDQDAENMAREMLDKVIS
ncbi:protein of unknown function [Kandleria vitulina]|uniref:FRG domain-containing protein n=1 Tax=Kandleria vitulina TaxID=1630 RepID=UPI0008B0CD47|nr:FRG domain-containing protein [Kandleria vitulina]SEI92890.1 protein of unknown function [Kandleria vitulina]